MLVGYSVKLLMVVILYIYMYTVNKRRDQRAAALGSFEDHDEQLAIDKGMQDMTELENEGFRYAL